ncbi:MAG TPA: DegV family protein [Candidatus Gallacutalibacter stercoravium]|nr:DegV family protein [Candidatus Gallacutalibacter stercoravium]
MGYRIITDSTADLSPELVADLGVEVIPMEFSLEGKNYFNYPDERELSSKDFYDMLRNEKSATTAQVTAARFEEIFEPFLQAGEDVLYIAFSSGLSGTYESSVMALRALQEKYPDRKMFSVDSLSASMGEGLLVYHAVMRQREGMTIEQLRDWLMENRLHLCHWFTVDDLNHLKRGGRISSATALLGTMLGIKPVLHVDDEGHLINVGKVRGRRQSIAALADNMEKTCVNPQDQTIFISHGDCLEDARTLEEMVKERFHVKRVYINPIGPVIGAHSGPGTVALFFLGTKR